MTTELFLVLCYKAGLTKFDLEDMTMAMCIDYVLEYIDHEKGGKSQVRKASQADFDCF
jgi:hypothetical protein